MSRRAKLAALLAAALAAAGCGGGGEESGSAAGGGANTKVHDVAAHDFSIALPDDWRAIEAEEVFGQEAVDEFAQDNPDAARYFREIAENELIKFFAFDPDVEEDFATNVNVIVSAVSDVPSFEEWSRLVIEEAEKVPTRVSAVKHSREELPAGEALRLEYRNEFRSGDSAKTVTSVQYVFVGEKSSYIVTFSTLPDQEAAYEPTFRAAAESFRFTG